MNNDLDSFEAQPHGVMRQGSSFTGGSAAERNAFLGSMGHELRNPLANIIAHVETLAEGVYGPLLEAQKEALAAIHDSARHLLQLVADVIDLGRIEANAPPVTQSTCVLGKKCASSIAMVAALAQARSIKLTSLVQPPDLRVISDPRRLQQIITELLSAAVLSAPGGDEVRLSVTGEDDMLHLQTLSSACPAGADAAHSGEERQGMPQNLLSRLEKIKPIGLALLQKWVHLHGGTFIVDEGTEISMSIRLPVSILPAAAPELETCVPESPGPVETPAPAPSAQATILIADDQPALITVTRNYLESLGFQVITARDGSEAVQRALTLQPDLILMDVRMPVVDGLNAIRQIRASADPKTRDIAIISLSGHAGAADQEKCLAAGATAYLSKPFGVRELDRIIADHLRPNRN